MSAAEGKLRLWRNTSLATHDVGVCTAGSAHRGLRVQRGRRQRLPPARADPALDHHRRGPGVPPGLRQPGRTGDHHPSPDALPGAQRGAGLQRRQHPVDVGPGRGARLQLRPGAGRQADAAGPGQPLRRHGGPAGHLDEHPGALRQERRHDQADRDDQRSRCRRRAEERRPDHHLRHRDRRGGTSGGRRGLDRRRGLLASRGRHLLVELHLHPARPGEHPGPGAGGRRQRQHRRRRQPFLRRHLPLQPVGADRPGPAGHRRLGGRRARRPLHPPGGRLRHRGAVLQGIRQQRNPRGVAVGPCRPAPGPGDVHRRDRDRVAERRLRRRRPGDRGPDLHRLLHRAQRALRVRAGGFQLSGPHRGAARRRRRLRQPAARGLRDHRHAAHRVLPATPTTSSTSRSPPPMPRPWPWWTSLRRQGPSRCRSPRR